MTLLRGAGLSKVKRDTLVYGASVVAERATSLLVLPLLTKNLSQELFGVWSQIIITYAAVSNLLLLGFYHAIVRFVAGRSPDDASSIFHRMLLVIVINSTFATALSLAYRNPLSELMFGSPVYGELIPVVFLFFAADCVFEFVALGLFRARQMINLCAVYYLVKSILRLAILAIGVLILRDFHAMMWALAGTQLVLVGFVYLRHVPSSVGVGMGALAPGLWKEIMAFSVPMVFATLVMWANNSLNRYLILHLLDVRAVGVFAAAYSIASIATLGALVLNFTLIPSVTASWNQGDHEESRVRLEQGTVYYLFFTLPVALSVGLAYEELNTILASADYRASDMLIYGIASGLLLTGLYQLLAFANLIRDSVFNLRIGAAALLLNAGLNWALIPAYGLTGSAMAGIASSALVLIANIRRAQQIFGYRLPWLAVGRCGLAGAAMLLVGLAARAATESAGPASGAVVLAAAWAVYIVSDLAAGRSVVRKFLGR